MWFPRMAARTHGQENVAMNLVLEDLTKFTLAKDIYRGGAKLPVGQRVGRSLTVPFPDSRSVI